MPIGSTPSIAVSRHALMAEAFELLADGLGPFIDERMADYFADEPSWAEAAANRLGRPAEHGAVDPLFQLLVLRRFWGPVFADTFGADLRGLIEQLIETRNTWAHFSLPEDIDELKRSVLAIERLLAPIRPELPGTLRKLRSRLDTPDTDEASEDAETDAKIVDPIRDGDASPAVDVADLEAQLTETETVFRELQDRYGDLESELNSSRRITAGKQLRLLAMERKLKEIERRSVAAEAFLIEERGTRYRVEWLFVGLLATLLLFMVLANT